MPKKSQAKKAKAPESRKVAARADPPPPRQAPPPRKNRARSRSNVDGSGPIASVPSVPAPPVPPSYKLVVVGPTIGGRVTACDSPVVLDLLSLVQQRHAVDIVGGVPAPNMLTIVGTSPHSLRAALADINLLEHSTGFGEQKQLFMVQASREQLQSVRLGTDHTTSPGLARFVLTGKTDKKENARAGDRGQQGLLQSHAVDFCSKLAQLTHVLRAVPRDLTLQAHLGRMMTSLGETSGSDAAAPAVQLGKIADGVDSEKVIFDRKLGDGKLFDVCREQAIKAKETFFPCSSVAEGLDDVLPARFLVIITAAFQIELEISPPKVDSQVARLSRSRVFQLVGASGRADLTVACPSHGLDWTLEVLPEVNAEDVPSTVADMTARISIAYPAPDEEDFPIPEIPAAVLATHRIKQVFGKTVWTVGCRGSPYLLELCRFHKFPRRGQAGGYRVSTGISVSSAAWADALRAPPAKGVCRDLDATWSCVFPPQHDGDGIADFLAYMQGMVKLWGGVVSSSDTASAAAATSDAAAASAAVLCARQQELQTLAETARIRRASAVEASHSTPVPSPDNRDAPQQVEEDLISFD